MTTEEELRGKALVQYSCWESAYKGIIDPEYPNKLTLDECIEKAYIRTTCLYRRTATV